MNHKNITTVFAGSVVVIIFNIIYYLTGSTGRGASVWTAYVFLHIAYAMLVLTAVILNRRKQYAELAITLNMISGLYFIAAFLMSIMLMALLVSVRWCVILHVLLFGVYIFLFFINLRANHATMDQEEVHIEELCFVRDCSSRMKALMERSQDRAAAVKLEKAYDYLHASPVKSVDSVMEYELEVIRLIGELEKNITVWDPQRTDQTLDKLMSLAAKRNRVIRNCQ